MKNVVIDKRTEAIIVELTILDKDVAFHNAYIRVSEDLLGSLLNKAFNPAGKGESRDRGRTSKTARNAPREIQ